MSVVAEPRRAPQGDEPATRCEHCGSPLEADQEWCLECGAARTLIHRPPDWRIAAAIVAAVVVLVMAGFAIALINLSASSNRSAATVSTAAATTTAGQTAATNSAPAARTAGPAATKFADWPVGLPGWTVVLFTGTSRSTAVATARQMSKAGLHVGILTTSQHPSTSMRPGHFAVFTGRYPTSQAAQVRATKLHQRGFRARARLVGKPGSP